VTVPFGPAYAEYGAQSPVRVVDELGVVLEPPPEAELLLGVPLPPELLQAARPTRTAEPAAAAAVTFFQRMVFSLVHFS
jgi:hypothetical protein